MSAEGTLCPKCSVGYLESRAKTSSLVCSYCGDVAEEGTMVLAVEFQEGPSGVSAMAGSYVAGNVPRGVGGEGSEVRRPLAARPFAPARTTRARVRFPARARCAGRYRQRADPPEGHPLPHPALPRCAWRAVRHSRRRLRHAPHRRRSPPAQVQSHHVDKAHRLYLLAFKSRKTHGRKLEHVLAVLLYLATRQDETAQSALLLDFAEAVGADVFTLGSLMLRLKSELSLRVHSQDPCLLIDHYSAKMELGDRRVVVAATANKIVGRMKRDWIAEGRRPAGICGAALLLAARIHGFRRTRAQMQQVVRVTETTIRSRMAEFGNTASSLMTATEFDKLVRARRLACCAAPSFCICRSHGRLTVPPAGVHGGGAAARLRPRHAGGRDGCCAMGAADG